MAIRFAEERHGLTAAQSRRDERPAARGGGIASGSDGAPAGTSSAPLQVPRRIYGGVVLFILTLLTVNVFTALHDARGSLETWKPFVSEYTAAVIILATMPAVALAAVRTPVGRGRWLRLALVHLLGSIVFCAVVVCGFVVLRKLIFAMLGRHYVFGGFGELVYEYRKLVLAYCGMVVVFRLSARTYGGGPAAPAAVQTEASKPEAEATFDIRDGAKLIRTPLGDILATRSAGNYVEFHLADGRRPLMRVTLSSVEAALQPHGFVRTHRSWLVNPSRLRALEPEGSGDWRILLDGGADAPLSRRYPEALKLLRRA
ncbi:LytTR family DNA-binding domain-containing protein [Caulobacter sp. S45]|uniref:LytTR family DNA-binding domain-containing protein n=1 Tax=Caulobacter sp. S45 TaxID=1641861 RepID=UPI00131AAE1B|nr:LytTR family DNA-binding domain-containing protein [Caulobacter sp. S45]